MISVIIPNYNHSNYLKQRIDSVLNQTYQDFEVILLDDLSNDGSDYVLELYKNHPKVSHLLINEMNSGSPFGMWQKGFDLAKGDIIWIAESDDWADPIFLETLVPKFKNNNLVVAHCISNNYYMNTNITKLNSWWTSFNSPLWDSDFIKDGRSLLRDYGKYKCPVINVSSALIRKNILVNLEIPVNYNYCGDWWFWAQVFNLGDVAYSSKALNYIRVHDSSATSVKKTNSPRRMDEIVKVINDISKLLGEKVSYNKNYIWLSNFWLKEILKNQNYLKRSYLFPNLSFNFLVAFYSKMLEHFFLKIK
ncbi:MAG: glycosyltransferase family 2 protein [Winogradskyella sp.]|uniref:glycosyltransferase family 2 protein n=1 Tax=Winogradskyella sp. TaxID=1883156 RepID=UPI00385B0392